MKEENSQERHAQWADAQVSTKKADGFDLTEAGGI